MYRLTRLLSNQSAIIRDSLGAGPQSQSEPLAPHQSLTDKSRPARAKAALKGCLGRQPYLKVGYFDDEVVLHVKSKAKYVMLEMYDDVTSKNARICYWTPSVWDIAKVHLLKDFCVEKVDTVQIASIVALWVIFLTFQQLKTRYDNCSWPYFGLFIAELILFLAATVAGYFLGCSLCWKLPARY